MPRGLQVWHAAAEQSARGGSPTMLKIFPDRNLLERFVSSPSAKPRRAVRG
ncbi:MAG: hypothetical protein OJF61_001177 [Rhodanobacteraceae bacterium]|nr:MAG: hypothetical protein OJF61_001177 [Rhodanobacteraceae bacterium]